MLDYILIANKLSEATSLVASSLEELGYAERVEDMYVFIKAGEYAVGMEHLCSNLHDFGCPVPLRAYNLLAEVGHEVNVDSEYWQLLKPQIIG